MGRWEDGRESEECDRVFPPGSWSICCGAQGCGAGHSAHPPTMHPFQKVRLVLMSLIQCISVISALVGSVESSVSSYCESMFKVSPPHSVKVFLLAAKLPLKESSPLTVESCEEEDHSGCAFTW